MADDNVVQEPPTAFGQSASRSTRRRNRGQRGPRPRLHRLDRLDRRRPAGHSAGDRFWLLTSRAADGSFHPDYDVHRVMWKNDPANPGRTTAKLFAAHAKAMTGASAG